MDFDLTRFGLIGTEISNKTKSKTDLKKTDKAEQTAEPKATIETKTADANSLEAQAALNLGFIRSVGAKQINGDDAIDVAQLYAMAGIINFRQPTEAEYARIGASTNNAMQNVMEAGTRANAEASIAYFEKYLA